MSEINYKSLRKPRKDHNSRSRYSSGGGVHSDEKEDRALIKKELSKAKIKVKRGGEVDGEKAPQRADKFARGGHTKKKGANTKVNVIVAGGGDHGAPPMLPPGGMPPRPAMPPPGAGPVGAGGPPAGAMPPRPMGPPMAARGGRMCRKEGGSVGGQEKKHDEMHHPLKKGGKCK